MAKQRAFTAAEEAQWAEDIADPDNWFQIPELDMLPSDVQGRGFARPICSPSLKPAGVREDIREMVRVARRLLRQQFATMADAHRANLDALDAMVPALAGEPPNKLTERQVVAVTYFEIMRMLERALYDATSTLRQEALATAGAWLARWACGIHEKTAVEIAAAGILRAQYASRAPYWAAKNRAQAWYAENRQKFRYATDAGRALLREQPDLGVELDAVLDYFKEFRRAQG